MPQSREQFYNQIMLDLSQVLDENSLQEVSYVILNEMNKYDISKRETEIVTYEYIPECVKTYLATRKIEGIKDSTLALYALRLKKFFSMVRKPLGDITADDIRIWLYNIQKQSRGIESENMSNRTLDGIRTAIGTFFKWATSEGYIDKNPCENIKTIKYTRKQRECLSEEELEALRGACDCPRDKAIIETFYSTGCRVSELSNLKISDINFEKDEITILGKGNKYRKSYINAKAKIAIKSYLDERNDDSPYLFVPKRNTGQLQIKKYGIEDIVKKLGKKANIEGRVYPHLIRHTTATLGLRRGMDITEIQRLLGHSSLDTTMIYAHVADESVYNSHKKYIV